MNAITSNPYRILGLLSNSNERELQKQISIIKRYAEIGKSKSFDYDFPFLGDILREQNSIVDASSKIEQAKSKIHYSLFWFISSNRVDELALNYLKENNTDKAIEIWEKLLVDNNITIKNHSAAINLSTLELGLTTLNGSFDYNKFHKSIELKGQIISSDSFEEFVNSVAGGNINLNRKLILNEFIDEVLQITKPYLDKNGGLTIAQLIESFYGFPSESKKYLLGRFIDKPINNIESIIEKTKKQKDANPSNAYEFGKNLCSIVEKNLGLLENSLSIKDLKYQLLINKIAAEVLDCGIAYFNFHYDSVETDPGNDSLELMQYAKSINPTGQVLDRINDNIKNVEGYVSHFDERSKNKKIKKELDIISRELDKLGSLSDGIRNVKNFLAVCEPEVDAIEDKLGYDDEFFIKVSNSVVVNAMNMLVSILNDALSNFEASCKNNANSFLDFNSLGYSQKMIPSRQSKQILEDTILDVYGIIIDLSYYDMTSEYRENFNKNVSSVENMKSQMNLSNRIRASRIGPIRNATPKISTEKKDNDGSNVNSKSIRNYIKYFWGFIPVIGALAGILIDSKNSILFGIIIGLIIGLTLKLFEKES